MAGTDPSACVVMRASLRIRARRIHTSTRGPHMACADMKRPAGRILGSMSPAGLLPLLIDLPYGKAFSPAAALMPRLFS